jgi:hypothetical protein
MQTESSITQTPNQIKRMKLRDAAYKILGDECCHCEEKNKIVLTIDHIQSCGKNRDCAYVMYLEIINNPDMAKIKYQLLCRNCNWKKLIVNNEWRSQSEKAQIKDEKTIIVFSPLLREMCEKCGHVRVLRTEKPQKCPKCGHVKGARLNKKR